MCLMIQPRGVSLRPAVRHSLRSALESHELELLHQSGLRRFAANWLRLVVLASALVGSDGKQSEDFTDTLEWVLPVHCLLPLLCFLVVTFGVWTFSFDGFRANCPFLSEAKSVVKVLPMDFSMVLVVGLVCLSALGSCSHGSFDCC